MKLPQEFLDRMKQQLGQEYDEFIESYKQPRYYGLRVNTLKISVDEFIKISPFKLEPIPWVKDGFYYEEGEQPGKHPYYHAGLYYIQEPSAMLPGAVVDAQPGERVLDLCAAPGGKSVQIAAGLRGEGILVCNDVSSSRIKALVKNLELCGVKNAVVLNETPDKLTERFNGFFDKIIIDAPCSGEGMFRKDEDAAKSWENFKWQKCACMQEQILESAHKMLKEGGKLVYSTCTFAPEEDERMIEKFLEQHVEFEIMDIDKIGGIMPGRPDWALGNPELTKTARLWPHKLKGEGHFVALLHKKGHETTDNFGESFNSGNAAKSLDKLLAPFREFSASHMQADFVGEYRLNGRSLYLMPHGLPDLAGIKVAKFGLFLGETDGSRFEPSHSLLMAMKEENLKNRISLPAESQEIVRYLKGETLMLDYISDLKVIGQDNKGWTAVCADRFPLGWAKRSGDMLKNMYPKGWRKTR